MGIPKRKIICFVNTKIAPIALAILAQNAIAAGLAIEEVVVTARKVEESIQDTPVAVTAMSGDELDVRGALDITDVASAAPNVSIGSGSSFSGSSSTPTVFMRGIGQSDFIITVDPAIGIYVDGVYFSRSIGSLVDLLDVERVEVLRGPQGTLFGRNTIGGALNIVSTQPSQDFGGNVKFTLGEDGWLESRATVNLPINDELSSRFSGFMRERDGYIDAVQYDDYQTGDQDVWGLRGQLRWDPTDNVSASLSADYSADRSGPAAFRLTTVAPDGLPVPPDAANKFVNLFNNVVSGDPACMTEIGKATNPSCFGSVHVVSDDYETNQVWVDEQGNRVKPTNKVDAWGVSLDVTWDVSWGEFKSITAFRTFDADFNQDMDGSPHVIFHALNSDFTNDQYSQEFQFTGTALNEQLDWIAGLYYFEEEGHSYLTLPSSLAVALNWPRSPLFLEATRFIDNTSKAVFGQATWHINDRLHLTTGLRWSEDEKDYRQEQAVLAVPNAAIGEVGGFLKISETTPLVNLAYDINNDMMAYINYSEGFRDGGFPPRVTGALTTLPSYDPEFVDVWELGLKSSFYDERVRVNLAVFRTSYDDIQVPATPVGGPPATIVPSVDNLASATLEGIELEVNVLATDSLRFDLAVGYLDASIEEVEGVGLASAGTLITENNQLPYTPEFTANLGVSHHLDLSDKGEIFTRIDWVYTDDQYYGTENYAGQFQEAYSVVNLGFSYHDPSDRWKVTLGVRNLTDKAYSTTAATSWVETNGITTNISRPRTGYITVGYTFGD